MRKNGWLTVVIEILVVVMLMLVFRRQLVGLVLQPYVFVLAICVLVAAAYFIPKLQIKGLRDDIGPERRVELENMTRATLSLLIGGGFLLVFVFWSGMADNREAVDSGNTVQRLKRAVDLFNCQGEKNAASRLGGLYALECIARDSAELEKPVIDTLTYYIRTHSSKIKSDPQMHMLPTETQAVLSVICRREIQNREEFSINLSGVDLHWAYMRGANLSNANLSSTDLRSAFLLEADLRDANLANVSLDGARLNDADLSGADLSHANMQSTNLSGVNLSNANLSGADLGNATLYRTDFSGADLSNADLRYSSLTRVNLGKVNLVGVKLKGANLAGMDLSHKDLSKADFTSADLGGANLNGTDLSGTRLTGANLSGTDLRGADGLTQHRLLSAVTDKTTRVSYPLRTRPWEPRKFNSQNIVPCMN